MRAVSAFQDSSFSSIGSPDSIATIGSARRRQGSGALPADPFRPGSGLQGGRGLHKAPPLEPREDSYERHKRRYKRRFGYFPLKYKFGCFPLKYTQTSSSPPSDESKRRVGTSCWSESVGRATVNTVRSGATFVLVTRDITALPTAASSYLLECAADGRLFISTRMRCRRRPLHVC
jgi:hypothetical protein